MAIKLFIDKSLTNLESRNNIYINDCKNIYLNYLNNYNNKVKFS